MSSSPTSVVYTDRIWTTRLLVGLGIYFATHVVLRVYVGEALEKDEAEQAILTQWWSFGYSSQPPLYTWLQRLFFDVFGLNVFSVSLLKNTLLFSAYVLVFLSANKVSGDPRRAGLAALSLLLMPQIAWESQRDLTHSVLVLTMSAATLYAVLGLTTQRSLVGYALFGLVLGLGILSKFNYLLFALVLILALMSTPAGRAMVLDRRMLAALGIMLLVGAPYGLWLISNLDAGTAKLSELGTMQDIGIVPGLTEILLAAFLFLTPLWLVYLVLFPKGFIPNRRTQAIAGALHIKRYLQILCLTLIAMFVLFGVTNFQERWMQPLLFVVPICFFSTIKPEAISQTSSQRFVRLAGFVAVMIVIALGFRVLGAGVLKRCSDHNYPVHALAEELRNAGFEEGTIVTEPHMLAGDLRLQFPSSVVLSPGVITALTSDLTGQDGQLALVWDAKRDKALPKSLEAYLKGELKQDLHDARAVNQTFSCRHAPGLSVEVGYAIRKL